MPNEQDPTPIRNEPGDENAASFVLTSDQLEEFGKIGKEQFGNIAEAFPNYKKGLLEAAKAGITSGVLAPVSFDIDSGDDSLPVVSWRIGTESKGHEQVFVVYRTGEQPRRIGQLDWSETDLPWQQKVEITTAAANLEVLNISFWDREKDRKFTNTQATVLGIMKLSDTLGFDLKRRSNKIQPSP